MMSQFSAYLTPSSNVSAASSYRSASPAPSSRTDGLVKFFAYGTDQWHNQVMRRCPSAKVYAIGRLRHYKFTINQLGYPNIKPSELLDMSDEDAKRLQQLGGRAPFKIERVYGTIYTMTEEDEAKMDVYQECPKLYTKEEHVVEYWPAQDTADNAMTPWAKVTTTRIRHCKVFMYMDKTNVSEQATCKPEIVYQIKMGIADAVDRLGISAKYIDEAIRPFLPQTVPTDPAAIAQIKYLIAAALDAGLPIRQLVDEAEVELIRRRHHHENTNNAVSGATPSFQWKNANVDEMLRGMEIDEEKTPLSELEKY